MKERRNSLLVLVRRRSDYAPEQKKKGMPDPDREELLRKGFARMGWPPYDPAGICRTKTGKPYVRNPQVPCEFNYSDAKTYCAAAFGERPIGIDIEEIRSPSVHLLRRLSAEERGYLRDAADPTERNRRFVRIWTAKEAFGKMMGTGLTKEILETDFTAAVGRVIPQRFFSDISDTQTVRMVTEQMTLCGTLCLFGQSLVQNVWISVCMKR